VAGHRTEQIHVTRDEAPGGARGDSEHAEHLLAHAQRHRHEALHLMGAHEGPMDGLRSVIHVVDEYGLASDGGASGGARRRLERNLQALEGVLLRVTARHPVAS